MLNAQGIKLYKCMAFNFLRRGRTDVSTPGSEFKVVTASFEDPVSPRFDEEGEQKATFYSKIIRVVLLVGAFLLPLLVITFNSSPLEYNKQLLLIIVSGVGLILWLLSIVSSGKLNWRSNFLDLSVLAVLGSTILATLFSFIKYRSMFGAGDGLSTSLVSIVALTIFYFLSVNTFEDGGKALRRVFSLSIAIALLYGLLQILGLHVIWAAAIKSRSFNTIGSVNALGLLAALSLPLFNKLKITTGYLRFLFIDKVGVVVALAILVILNWWVLWTVAIAGMVGMIVFENMRAAKFRMSRFLLPMTVIVLSVFLLVINFNINAVKKNLPVEIAPSYQLSGDVAVKSLKDSIVFGYGPENFSLAFDKYGAYKLADTTLSTTKFSDATSEFINMVTQNGLVGVAALLFLIWTIVWGIVKSRNTIRSDESGDTVGMLSFVFAVFVAMFFYPFNTTIMFVMYVALALMALSLWGQEKKSFSVEDKAWLSLTASLGFIAGLILVLVGVYFGAAIYASDINYVSALKLNLAGNSAQSSADAKTSLDNYKKAQDSMATAVGWSSYDDRFYRADSQIALNMLSVEINRVPEKGEDANLKAQNIQGYSARAVDSAQKATQISPRESANWSNLGNVYQALLGLVDGVDKLAADSYNKALELRPGDASLYLGIGNTYLAKSDLSRQLAQNATGDSATKLKKDVEDALAKSEEAFKKAVELANNYGVAIYNLGTVYDREGKTAEAITQLEKIAPANANQPGLFFELGLLYSRANNKDQAIAAMQRAIFLSPEYSNARWYLGLLLEERKDYAGAIEQMEKILATEANKDNATVLTKLEELRKGGVAATKEKAIDQKPLP